MKGGLTHKQAARGRRHFEEHAQRQLDRAVRERVPRIRNLLEKEQHPVARRHHRQSVDARVHAVLAHSTELPNQNRATRDPSLQHLRNLEDRVGGRVPRSGSRHDGPHLAEDDDRRPVHHHRVARVYVDDAAHGRRDQQRQPKARKPRTNSSPHALPLHYQILPRASVAREFRTFGPAHPMSSTGTRLHRQHSCPSRRFEATRRPRRGRRRSRSPPSQQPGRRRPFGCV